MCDGMAFHVGFENPNVPQQGYGIRVMQRMRWNDEEYFLWYGHLSSVLVEESQMITGGQLIAHSGNTGRSTGPHLHVGCRKSNTSEFLDMKFKPSEAT
jgi:hypothetical protein